MISALRFTPARERADGLAGFVSFRVGPLLIDSVVLRRTATGEYVLAFPERLDRKGVAHPVVRPLDPAARAEITEAVVSTLRRQGWIP